MATLASMTVRLGIDTDRLRDGADKAKRILSGLGKAVGGLGVGAPAAAAATVAVGGMAAAFASAGIAAKAFQLAVGPQMKAVADVATLAEEAEKAAAAGAEDAAEKQKAYTDALAELPPASRATAKEFIGLRKDYKSWSDSLSGSTMPIFTKGLQIVRRLLPLLTPFVKAAAKAIGEFVDEIDKSTKGKGLEKFADSMAKVAGKNLKSLLNSLKNIAVGVGGIIGAFLPLSDEMSGGFESATASFAEWGKSLGDSEGFAEFVALAKEGGQQLGTLAKAGIELVTALGPLIGITAQIALGLAELINKIPPPVLSAIATAIGAIVIGMKLYAAYTAIASAVTRGWAIAQTVLNAVMAMNPLILVTLLIVALVAAIVIAYQKSETFRAIVQAVWAAVRTAISVAVKGILAAVGWLAKLPGRIADWFGQAKDWAIKKFVQLNTWVAGLPGRLFNALAGLAGKLSSRARDAGASMVRSLREKLTSAVNWVRGLPGRARDALGNLGSKLANAGRQLIQGFIDGIKSKLGAVKDTLGGLTNSLTSWKGPESLDKRILTPAGRYVIGGFQDGIAAQIPALRRQLQGITGDLPGMTVAAPRGVTRTPPAPPVRVELDVTGGEDDMARMVRKWDRTRRGM